MRTNVPLTTVSYTLSAGGVSGFSSLILSYAIAAPDDLSTDNGGFVLGLVNSATTAPLHVELRSVWTDLQGVSYSAGVATRYLSNAQTYGGSAAQAQTLTLLASGQGAWIAYQDVVGSAIQCWIYAASTIADAAAVKGSVTLWRT